MTMLSRRICAFLMILFLGLLFSSTLAQQDPNFIPFSLQQRLSANDYQTLDYDGFFNHRFAQTIALDGDTALVGAPSNEYEPYSMDYGTVYVIDRQNDTWKISQKLTSPQTRRTSFGIDVALKGNTAVVAERTDNRGWVNIYERINNVWTLKQILGDLSFRFVSKISLDGDTLAVHADVISNYSSKPRIYIYQRSGTEWVLKAEIISPSSYLYNQFGESITLKDNLLVIGAPAENVSPRGAIYTFLRTGEAWVQQQAINPPQNSTKSHFGSTTTLLEGGVPGYSDDLLFTSASSDATGIIDIYSYRFDGSKWVHTHTWTLNDPQYRYLTSRNVSLEAKGEVIALSSEAISLTDEKYYKRIHVFKHVNDTWNLSRTISVPTSDNGSGLAPVAINGVDMLVGDPDYGQPMEFAGNLYFYTLSGDDWIQQGSLQPPLVVAGDADPEDHFGGTIALVNDQLLIGAPPAIDRVLNKGAVYVYQNTGENWSVVSRLRKDDVPFFTQCSECFDGFGSILAVDGETALIRSSYYSTNYNSLYVYKRVGGSWQNASPLPPFTEEVWYISSVAFRGNTAAILTHGAESIIHIFSYVNDGWQLVTTFSVDKWNALRFDLIVLDESTLLAPYTASPNIGGVKVFRRSGSTWVEDASFQLTLAPNESFYSAAIQGDTAFIGIEGSDTSASRVLVYKRTASGWELAQTLVSQTPTVDTIFGISIAVEGNLAVIGEAGPFYGWDDVVVDTPPGKAYIYQYSGTEWVLQQMLEAPGNGKGNYFGAAIQLNDDILAIGAHGDNEGKLEETGAVYVYQRDIPATETSVPTTVQPTNTSQPTLEPTASIEATITQEATVTQEATAIPVTASPEATVQPPTVTQEATVTQETTAIPVTASPEATLQPPTETPPASDDLLTNAGFEDGVNGWTIKNSTGDKVKCNKEGIVIAHEGNCAFQFKGSEGEASKLSQEADISTLTLSTGDVLTLSGFVDAKGAVKAAVKVTVMYATMDVKGKISAKINTPTDGYQPLVSLPLTLSDTPDAIKIQISNRSTSGRIRFDALSLGTQTQLMDLPE
jgi:hypothetical protein